MADSFLEAVRRAPDSGRLKEVKFGQLLTMPKMLDNVANGVAQANAYAYGWDTVFAIRLTDVNRAIALAESSPAEINEQAPDGSCSIAGSFDHWEVCGGDSTLLHFRVPIRSAQFTANGETYDVDGADAIIEVRLEYLAHASEPTAQNLKVQSAGDNGEPKVSLIDLRLRPDSQLAQLEPNFVQTALLSGLLDLWFRQNLDKFQHVFTAVELNHRIDQEQFQWLTPTYTGYALSAGETLQTSLLGVLCMTQNRSPAGLAAQVSPNAIPRTAQAGFLVAQERFLSQMVLPSLSRAFPGSKSSDFRVHADGDRVVNTAPVKLKTVAHLGLTYQPVLVELEVRVAGDEVIVSSITRTDIALGTYSEVKVTSFQRLKLADKPGGGQTLVYEESRPPIEDHSTKSTASGQLLQDILTIALVVIMIILAVLTAGAVLVVGLIILALLIGLKTAGPELVAKVVGNEVSKDSPSLALLASSATSPIRWAGSTEFELTELRLGHSLQLAGNIGFF